MSREPALLTSAGRMPERSQHRVSEGQDARSERPATGHGQPRTVADTQVARVRSFALRRQAAVEVHVLPMAALLLPDPRLLGAPRYRITGVVEGLREPHIGYERHVGRE